MSASEDSRRHRYGIWWLASVALALASLALTFESDAVETSPTWMKFLFGWIYVTTGETMVWLSLPLTLAAWLCLAFRAPRAALVLSALAVGNALVFLEGPAITYGWGDHIHRRAQIAEEGYFVWLSAMILTVVSAVQLRRRQAGDAIALSGATLALVIALLAGPWILHVTAKAARKAEIAASERRETERKRQVAKKAADQRLNIEARARAGRWEQANLSPHAVNAIAHAPAGAKPPRLGIARKGEFIEITNGYETTVTVDVWFPVHSPDGTPVFCKYFPPKGTPRPGGFVFGLPVKLAPGQADVVRVNAPALEFGDDCQKQAATAALNFLVRSPDSETILFASDPAFRPSPPPRAESVHRHIR